MVRLPPTTACAPKKPTDGCARCPRPPRPAHGPAALPSSSAMTASAATLRANAGAIERPLDSSWSSVGQRRAHADRHCLLAGRQQLEPVVGLAHQRVLEHADREHRAQEFEVAPRAGRRARGEVAEAIRRARSRSMSRSAPWNCTARSCTSRGTMSSSPAWKRLATIVCAATSAAPADR